MKVKEEIIEELNYLKILEKVFFTNITFTTTAELILSNHPSLNAFFLEYSNIKSISIFNCSKLVDITIKSCKIIATLPNIVNCNLLKVIFIKNNLS